MGFLAETLHEFTSPPSTTARLQEIEPMKKTLSLLLFSSTIILAPLVSAEDLIDGDGPSGMLEVAREFGQAELMSDDYGEPLILGFFDDLVYTISFYNCSEDNECGDVFMLSYLMFDRPPSLTRVNAWNRNNRLGKVELDDEGDLALTITIVLEGGITRTNLKNIFQRYKSVYMRVERYFPEGTRMGSDDQSSVGEEYSGESYFDESFPGNIDPELDSFLEEFVSTRIKEVSIDVLLSDVAEATMEANPDGYRENKNFFNEDIKAVGSNLFYSYVVSPTVESYYNQKVFSDSVISRACSLKYIRKLFEEGAKFHYSYRYEGETEEFMHIVVDMHSCKNVSE